MADIQQLATEMCTIVIFRTVVRQRPLKALSIGQLIKDLV